VKDKLLTNVLLVASFLTLGPIALASTIWYVNGVNGSDNHNCKSPTSACKTIKHAISLASSGDTIMVAPATYKENLTIGISLKILGASTRTTIIDGGGVTTVVTIPTTNPNVTLSNLTIRNGFGAGISNNGTLLVSSSTINGNTGLIGGGVSNSGRLTITNSTISGNVARSVFGGRGGGVFNGGTLTLSNSTISGNLAAGRGFPSFGGGIFNGGTLTISNSTISGNRASAGGGISNSGTATLQNSILLNSTFFGGDCNGSITSDGYNLSGDNSCNLSGPGDHNNTDPLLGFLQNNGGPTDTMALLNGSPAIDSGNPSGCTDGHGHLLKTDQRGMPRPDKEDSGSCDRGAYERQKD